MAITYAGTPLYMQFSIRTCRIVLRSSRKMRKFANKCSIKLEKTKISWKTSAFNRPLLFKADTHPISTILSSMLTTPSAQSHSEEPPSFILPHAHNLNPILQTPTQSKLICSNKSTMEYPCSWRKSQRTDHPKTISERASCRNQSGIPAKISSKKMIDWLILTITKTSAKRVLTPYRRQPVSSNSWIPPVLSSKVKFAPAAHVPPFVTLWRKVW